MTRVQRLTIMAAGLGLFMIFLDALIVNVALPDIQAAFGVGEAGLQWVVSAYSIGMAVVIMSVASVADRLGRRRVFLRSMSVFTAASVVCGLAPGIWVLAFARVVQGVAAAGVSVTSLALLSAAFPDKGQRARAIGIWSGIAAVAIAVGPTIGGVLTSTLGWRAIFFVNVPVAAVAGWLTVRFVAESRDPVSRDRDPAGQVLFAVLIATFAFGVVEGPHRGWDAPVIVGCFVVAAAALVAFIQAELRREQPMVDLRLFANRTYRLAIITIFTKYFAIYGMLLVITQFFQNVRGYSPISAGLLILPYSVASVIVAPLSGRIVAKANARTPTLVGTAVLATGLVGLIVGVGIATPIAVVSFTLVGFGAAMVTTTTATLGMGAVPADRAGMASGILSVQRALGAIVGVAVVGSILSAWLSGTVQHSLRPVVARQEIRHVVATRIVEDANPQAYVAEVGPGRPLASPTRADRHAIREAVDHDFVVGIQIGLGLCAGLLVLVLVADAAGLRDGRGSP